MKKGLLSPRFRKKTGSVSLGGAQSDTETTPPDSPKGTTEETNSNGKEIRESLKALRNKCAIILELTFHYLYYALDDTHNLPPPNIQEFREMGAAYDDYLKTRKGQCLLSLVNTAPFLTLFKSENNATITRKNYTAKKIAEEATMKLNLRHQQVHTNIFLNESHQPCIPEELRETVPFYGHVIDYFRYNDPRGIYVGTGIHSPFRFNEDILNQYMKLAALLIEIGKIALSFNEAAFLSHKHDDIFTSTDSIEQLQNLLNTLSALCKKSNEDLTTLTKPLADRLRGLKRKTVTSIPEDEAWKKNMTKLFTGNHPHKQSPENSSECIGGPNEEEAHLFRPLKSDEKTCTSLQKFQTLRSNAEECIELISALTNTLSRIETKTPRKKLTEGSRTKFVKAAAALNDHIGQFLQTRPPAPTQSPPTLPQSDTIPARPSSPVNDSGSPRNDQGSDREAASKEKKRLFSRSRSISEKRVFGKINKKEDPTKKTSTGTEVATSSDTETGSPRSDLTTAEKQNQFARQRSLSERRIPKQPFTSGPTEKTQSSKRLTIGTRRDRTGSSTSPRSGNVSDGDNPDEIIIGPSTNDPVNAQTTAGVDQQRIRPSEVKKLWAARESQGSSIDSPFMPRKSGPISPRLGAARKISPSTSPRAMQERKSQETIESPQISPTESKKTSNTPSPSASPRSPSMNRPKPPTKLAPSPPALRTESDALPAESDKVLIPATVAVEPPKQKQEPTKSVQSMSSPRPEQEEEKALQKPADSAPIQPQTPSVKAAAQDATHKLAASPQQETTVPKKEASETGTPALATAKAEPAPKPKSPEKPPAESVSSPISETTDDANGSDGVDKRSIKKNATLAFWAEKSGSKSPPQSPRKKADKPSTQLNTLEPAQLKEPPKTSEQGKPQVQDPPNATEQKKPETQETTKASEQNKSKVQDPPKATEVKKPETQEATKASEQEKPQVQDPPKATEQKKPETQDQPRPSEQGKPQVQDPPKATSDISPPTSPRSSTSLSRRPRAGTGPDKFAAVQKLQPPKPPAGVTTLSRASASKAAPTSPKTSSTGTTTDAQKQPAGTPSATSRAPAANHSPSTSPRDNALDSPETTPEDLSGAVTAAEHPELTASSKPSETPGNALTQWETDVIDAKVVPISKDEEQEPEHPEAAAVTQQSSSSATDNSLKPVPVIISNEFPGRGPRNESRFAKATVLPFIGPNVSKRRPSQSPRGHQRETLEELIAQAEKLNHEDTRGTDLQEATVSSTPAQRTRIEFFQKCRRPAEATKLYTNEDIPEIQQALKSNPEIKTVLLQNNIIGPCGAVQLWGVLSKHTPLTTLCMSNNPSLFHEITKQEEKISENLFGRASAKGFADLLANHTSLQHLMIDECGIGPIGASFLANGIKQNESLVTLDIRHNDITDDSVNNICEALRKHPKIESVLISANRLTEKGGLALLELLRYNTRIINLEFFEDADSFDPSREEKIENCFSQELTTQLKTAIKENQEKSPTLLQKK